MTDRIIYMNNAATTWPKPDGVAAEVSRCLQLPFHEEGRSTVRGQVNYPEQARQLLADLFHADAPDRFVFSQNATDSLNTAIHGFLHHDARRAGRAGPCHVITTALEHNAVLRPLRTLEREGAITLSIVPFTDGYVRPDAIRDAVQDDTRLVVMTHGSNVLGTVQEVGRIGEYCQNEEIFFVVDGAQTAGQIDIDLARLHADVFAFTGHKALFGLPGIGGFYIGSEELVDPVRQGGTGTDSAYPYQPDAMPAKFETGTQNYPGIASLCAGIRFIRDRGIATIGRMNSAMTRSILGELRTMDGIILHHDNPDLPVIPLSVRGIGPDDTGLILARIYSIICRTGLHCAPLVHDKISGGKGCVRLSLSCLNTMEECAMVAGALREVAGGADPAVSAE